MSTGTMLYSQRFPELKTGFLPYMIDTRITPRPNCASPELRLGSTRSFSLRFASLKRTNLWVMVVGFT